MLLVFGALGFLIYSNTFDASFHYDDKRVISNLSLEDMIDKCKGGGSRFICHLTFALNYWLGGTDVLGYHIFNTLIHIGTAYFVYIFLFQILAVSNPNEIYASSLHTDRFFPPLTDPVFWPALLGGILFLVHPLATQSVTYITQRYASLAGFFYIGSLAFFVSARIRFRENAMVHHTGQGTSLNVGIQPSPLTIMAHPVKALDAEEKRCSLPRELLRQNEFFLSRNHLVPYLYSIVMAVLAMRTKEMSITLPAAVLLTEYYFIQSDFSAAGKRILYLLPLLATGLIIPVSDMIGIEAISLETVAALQDYTWDSGAGITRMEYLFTQFKIILGIYLKLMVWPISQNIDHDYVMSKTLFDLPTMASFLALCLILGLGLWLFRRAKFVSFGILWFFVTISPTSSIVPNVQFVAEQRAYISLMGLAFAVAGLPAWQTRWKRYLLVLLPALILLSGLTYARNRVWKTDLTLWKDSVLKSPKKARPHNNMGAALSKEDRTDEAIEHYKEALRIKPDYMRAHSNLVKASERQGRIDEIIEFYLEALRIKPDYKEAHYNLGIALQKQGRTDEAIEHYKEALRIKPNFEEAHNNLGYALECQGRIEEAIKHYKEALRIRPNFEEAHNNLGSALQKQGRIDEAIEHYKEALRIRPDFEEAHNNLGAALQKQGRIDEAIEHFREALRVKPDYVKAHNNLGCAFYSNGNIEAAIDHFQKALQIDPDFSDARRNLQIILKKG